MQVRSVTVRTADGLRLEGRLAEPAEAAGAAIVCHAHPELGGTMSIPPIPDVHRAIARHGWASLRFNFRGVARSEGRFDAGRGEQTDTRAALDFAGALVPGAPLGVAGWSFGSLVGIAAAAGDARVRRFVAIAPPVDSPGRFTMPVVAPPERIAGWEATGLAIVGTEDPVATPVSVERWAKDTFGSRCRVEVVDGADHRFSAHREMLAELVGRFLTEAR